MQPDATDVDRRADQVRREWLQTPQALEIREALGEKTADERLVEHLLHQASYVGRHTVEGRDLIGEPETYAELLWATHKGFDAYAEVAFEEISRAAREL